MTSVWFMITYLAMAGYLLSGCVPQAELNPPKTATNPSTQNATPSVRQPAQPPSASAPVAIPRVTPTEKPRRSDADQAPQRSKINQELPRPIDSSPKSQELKAAIQPKPKAAIRPKPKAAMPAGVHW